MIIGATAALDQVIQLVLATLMVEVAQFGGDDAALLRDVGFAGDFGDIEVDERSVLVMDHRGSALGIGKNRAGGEEGCETEDVHFHDKSLF